MRIGFIGAGKVGVSFGKFLTIRGHELSGYLSRTFQSAEEAAFFTHSTPYQDVGTIVRESDLLFLTVPDDKIASVWKEIKELPIQNKIICHCSGACSSAIFSDIGTTGAYGFSVHPFIPINNKEQSYKDFEHALFTVEGDDSKLSEMVAFLKSLGNQVVTISKEDKVRYHAAAVMASNLFVGLTNCSVEMLKSCGFEERQAYDALAPLIRGNVNNILEIGVVNALTGPMERNDVATIRAHLEHLEEKEKNIYCSLGEETLKVAEKKHPKRNYQEIEHIIKGE